MKILQECYNISFSKITFLERKVKISDKKTLIFGANKVGKSYLIYDFLSNFKANEYLYIDFSDLRNSNIYTEIEFLQEFITKNDIKVLVLENIKTLFSLPKCEYIIISSLKDINLDEFSKINLKALDFEEYLLFDNKHQNITQSFNSFLKHGNLPEIVFTEDHKKLKRVQEIALLNTKDSVEYEIFKILLENIDEKKSLFQLFNTLKNRIKISKDRFYEVCKDFEDKQLFYYVPKYNQEKSAKKIYSYNHNFLSSLNHSKKFKNEFSNMIFLEITKNSEVFYLDLVDFYIKSKKLFILCIPFFNLDLNMNLIKKVVKTALEMDIAKIEIITVSNQSKIKNFDINIEAIPFYEWAVLN